MPVEVWEMPGAADFEADIGVDTGAGGTLKREALERLGLPGAHPPREVFRVLCCGKAG
jgi:hypothetical protein